MTKICDLGMESGVFVLHFQICIRGVGFGIKGGFCVFGKWGFWEEFSNLFFWDLIFNPFKSSNLKIKAFELK